MKKLLIALMLVSFMGQAQWHQDHDKEQAWFEYEIELKNAPKILEFPMASFAGKGNVLYKNGVVRIYNIRWSGGIMLGGSGGNFTGYMDQILWNKRGKYKHKYMARYEKMLTEPIKNQLNFLNVE